MKKFGTKKGWFFYLAFNCATWACVYCLGWGIDRMVHEEMALGSFNIICSLWYGLIASFFARAWWNE